MVFFINIYGRAADPPDKDKATSGGDPVAMVDNNNGVVNNHRYDPGIRNCV